MTTTFRPPLYTSPSVVSTTTTLQNSSRWRTMVDNCTVEFLASLFLMLATVFAWNWKNNEDIFDQFIPAMALGLILLILKDEDYFFPDAAWTVTLVLWALGGYGSWTHVLSRIVGQTLAWGVAFWICMHATIPDMVYIKHHPLWIVFMLEMLATAIEHMAVVYVIMPLLPPTNSHGANFLFPKVKPKADKHTKAPSNPIVMHAAVTFSALHWLLWRAFGTEMNPALTLLIAFLRHRQHHAEDPWQHATMAVWGQLVGLLLCIIYAAVYVPRESKAWQ